MNKKSIILVIVLTLLVAALAVAYFLVQPGGIGGKKDSNPNPQSTEGTNDSVEYAYAFTLVVVHKDGTQKEMPLKTNREYLGPALQDEGIIKGDMGEFGLYIKEVDGEKAVFEEDGAYWAFYVGDEYAILGIDKTPIENGKTYKLVYTADTYGG